MSPTTRKLILAGLGIAAVIAAWLLLPVREWLIAFVAWVRDHGAGAAVVFAVVYVLAAVLLVPGTVLTLGAGFIYGPLWGSLLVVVASNAAALCAFGIARRFTRGWIADRVRGNRKFEALDRAIGDAGFKITLLVRLSPVFPYGLLNYALGLTGVDLRSYLLGTLVGMLPATVVVVYLGSLITNVADVGTLPSQSGAHAFYWVGLGVAVVAAVVTTLVARRALRAELAEARA
ncbi:MAG: TVP38/TMEM64 family protein [Deltaproteobacteria bacterium]|nr:TVP38/TMEM64 family protein [Deltaproteobacteria bacterium]